MKAHQDIDDLKRQNEQTLLMLWQLGESLVATTEKGGVPEGCVKKEPRPARTI